MDRTPRTPDQQKSAKALYKALQNVDLRRKTIDVAYELTTALYKAGFYVAEISDEERLARAKPSSELVH